MVKLRNHTSFSGAVFKKYNARQELTVTVTSIAAFSLTHDHQLKLLSSQPKIRLSDSYVDEGQPYARLIEVSDFVPFRPATDIVVLGEARSLDGKPRKNWPVSLTVNDMREALIVHGPRHWYKGQKGRWEISTAEAVVSVPLDWSLSTGGVYLVPEDSAHHGQVDIWNPVGTGVIVPGVTTDSTRYPAPQIEGADAPITQPDPSVVPRNLCPIAPVWRFREQYAGSYDQTWLKTQHPFLPSDFNPAFYNSAPPVMQAKPYLRGDEIITLAGMDEDFAEVRFSLPGLAFGAVVTHDNNLTVRQPLNLDMVELDWRDNERIIRLSWRGAFPWRDGIQVADLGELSFETLHPPQQSNAYASG